MLIMVDPPRHTKMRQIVNKSFTPRAVAPLENRFREIAAELIAAVAPRGECDLVADPARDHLPHHLRA
jgi:cytochrome P450